ncbi:TPA: RusA family crossover junction endodeoxyribonuclease, partial [Vibrio parahaemolyticus]|nr:RusA family crossover junction endodeoxyribonuclease [Vibrio parahaemolyticus]
EQKRYETSTSADIDNIIKPLLDAFCGPEGIMIDDNQVQSVTCNWIDYHNTEKERLVVTVKYIPDDIVIKEGLFFVDVGDNLYMPLFDYLTPEIKKLMLSMYEKMVDARNQMMEAGLDYYSTKGIMSVQRVFHKGRLEGFVLKSKEEL